MYFVSGDTGKGKLIIWLYPSAVFIDSDLLPLITLVKEFFASSVNEFKFHGSMISVNGIPLPLSPLITCLHEQIAHSAWPRALALARLDNPNSAAIWAALAGASLAGRDLYTAELAYSACDRLDRVSYIRKMSALPPDERAIEMALLLGNRREAEVLCEKNAMWLRLVMIYCEACQWNRASEVAKVHDLENLVNYCLSKYHHRFGQDTDFEMDSELEKLIQNPYQNWPK